MEVMMRLNGRYQTSPLKYIMFIFRYPQNAKGDLSISSFLGWRIAWDVVET